MRAKSIKFDRETNKLSTSVESACNIPTYQELPNEHYINRFHIYGSYEIRQGKDCVYIESTNGKWSNIYYDSDSLTLAIVEER